VGIQNDVSIAAIIEYLSGASQVIDGVAVGDTKRLFQKSFYDAVGGYLNHFLYPYTKMVFYAGNLTYQTVVSVQELLNYCETLLNTKGLGWASPIADLSAYKLSILKLNLESGSESTSAKPPCVDLAPLDEENDDDILVNTPKIDNDDPGTIWLPFKRKRAFSLNSQASSFVLMRYFVKVSECYAFQGVDQTKFNLDLLSWLSDNVPGYLASDEFYPAFGGVLRIFETIDPGAGQKVMSLMKNKRVKGKLPISNARDEDYPSEPVLGLPIHDLLAEDDNGLKYKILRAVVFGGTLLMFLAVLCCMCKMWRQHKKIKRQNMTGREKRPHRREEKKRVPESPDSEASSYTPTSSKPTPRSNQDYLKRMEKFQDKTKSIASMVKINEKHPANRSRYQDIKLFAVDSSLGEGTSTSSSTPRRKAVERKPGKR
jgi:hypothetical protein